MSKTQTRNDTPNAKTILALGAGVAALATASYYFFGPKGKTHRDQMKGWMIKMKGEIVDKIEDVKELTEPVYHGIVDSVAAAYLTTAKVSKDELEAFKDRLKSQWREIVAESKVRARIAEADARLTTKRVARKAVKRTVRKTDE